MFSNKVNGHAASGEHLTSNIDYFTITTPVDLANATIANNVATALDKLIEIVSLRGQPVIMGTVQGTGPYTLNFATEHFGSWAVEPASPTGTYGAGPQDAASLANAAMSAMQNAIVQNGVDYGFNSNTTVTVSSSL
jgi:hypothetical protein